MLKIAKRYSPKEIAKRREYIRRTRRGWSVELAEVPRSEWPPEVLDCDDAPVRVLRNSTFLVQIFEGSTEYLRMSVCRTSLDDNGNWRDGITWDELQQLKREAGYGNWFAVEVYPADYHVVNVANMRHLWLLSKRPPYAWENS